MAQEAVSIGATMLCFKLELCKSGCLFCFFVEQVNYSMGCIRCINHMQGTKLHAFWHFLGACIAVIGSSIHASSIASRGVGHNCNVQAGPCIASCSTVGSMNRLHRQRGWLAMPCCWA